jgi:diguanylate cyclase (GGDEF)-like protein
VSIIEQWSAAGAPLAQEALATDLGKLMGQDLVDLFLQDGASYLVVQCEQPESEALVNLCTLLAVTTLVIVPVFAKAEFFGLLILGTNQTAGTNPRTDLPILYQIADHAAIALHHIMQSPPLQLPQGDRPDQGQQSPLQSWYDVLTHLPNRPALERELSHLSHPTLWPVDPAFSVLLGDIDYFKLINDTHGNAAGDEVLQEIARRLQAQLRQGTQVYRFDGEEFLVVLNNTQLRPAADVAERLRAVVQQTPIKTQAGNINVTLSFGVAQKELERDRQAIDIVRRAEQALLVAKREGRNRVKVQ